MVARKRNVSLTNAAAIELNKGAQRSATAKTVKTKIAFSKALMTTILDVAWLPMLLMMILRFFA